MSQVGVTLFPFTISVKSRTNAGSKWDESTEENSWQSKQIRKSCGIQPINEWVEKRRRNWDEHVTRMGTERLVKISMGDVPTRRRSLGRPKIRWSDLTLD